jgi:hypothetical protein
MMTLGKHNKPGGICHAHIVEDSIIPWMHAKLFFQTQRCGVGIATPTLTGGISAVSTLPNSDPMRFHLQDGDKVKHMEIAGTTTTTVREEEATTTILQDVEMGISTTQEAGTMDRGTTLRLVNP